MPRPYPEEAMEGETGPDTSDEEMLETVRQAMGGGGPGGAAAGAAGPPPGSGMKWENLEEDQQALLDNPTPENVEAFVQYWGEDNLPEEIRNPSLEAVPDMPGDAGGGMY